VMSIVSGTLASLLSILSFIVHCFMAQVFFSSWLVRFFYLANLGIFAVVGNR